MIKKLKHLCFKTIIDEKFNLLKHLTINDIDIIKNKSNDIGHFQFNGIMKIAKILDKDSLSFAHIIAEKIMKNMDDDDFYITVTSPGFINFTLKPVFFYREIELMLKKKEYRVSKKFRKKIIIDYSSPNVAKDMHVGHLRSTIIGECLSNIFSFFGHNVMKISHLGDWGTQFGILINYLELIYLNHDINKINFTLKKLSDYYKIAQSKFDLDESFRISAKKIVVRLQNKDSYYLSLWKKITDISKREYKKIYSLLEISVRCKGESFYSDMLPAIVKRMEKKKLIVSSYNAKCVFLDGFKNKNGLPLPVIIQKSDGGYNYMTTDVAALYYRVKYNKPDKIIYVTDVGQKDHFLMMFELFKKLNLNKKKIELIHIPLGLMLSKDGKKIKTRSGDSKKLIVFLRDAIRSSKIVNKNNFKKAKVIGINTVKYSELSNRMNQNYIFDFDKMLKYNGNTAVFLMYAYARIISIEKNIKKQKNINILNFDFPRTLDNFELNILLHIIQYERILERTLDELNPNLLTFYLYELADNFHSFFHKCNVINSEKIRVRFMICKLTKKILKTGFKILGLNLLQSM